MSATIPGPVAPTDLSRLGGYLRAIRECSHDADSTHSFLRRHEILRKLDRYAAECEAILRSVGAACNP